MKFGSREAIANTKAERQPSGGHRQAGPTPCTPVRPRTIEWRESVLVPDVKAALLRDELQPGDAVLSRDHRDHPLLAARRDLLRPRPGHLLQRAARRHRRTGEYDNILDDL
jgi:hypothetical protein